MKKTLLSLTTFLSLTFLINHPIPLAQGQNNPPKPVNPQLISLGASYPSDAQIAAAESEFQRLTQGISGRGYVDNRTRRDIQNREKFVRAWSKVDPAVAPFLGQWLGFEESLSIFPSKKRGEVCIEIGGIDGSTLMQGFVSAGKLYTTGGSVNSVLVRKKGKLRSGQSTDFLGSFFNYQGSTQVSTYTLPTPLTKIDFNLRKSGCTTSLSN